MMDIEKLVKGDIVRNRFAGDENPRRFMVYLGKSTIRQGRYSHKGYTCLDYDGRKTQIFRENDPLVKVGHMAEYDAFIAAFYRCDCGEQHTWETDNDFCSYGERRNENA